MFIWWRSHEHPLPHSVTNRFPIDRVMMWATAVRFDRLMSTSSGMRNDVNVAWWMFFTRLPHQWRQAWTWTWTFKEIQRVTMPLYNRLSRRTKAKQGVQYFLFVYTFMSIHITEMSIHFHITVVECLPALQVGSETRKIWQHRSVETHSCR